MAASGWHQLLGLLVDHPAGLWGNVSKGQELDYHVVDGCVGTEGLQVMGKRLLFITLRAVVASDDTCAL